MKFSWGKKELILNVSQLNLPWISSSALTPTPLIISSDIIRVYCGFRDESGISRIGFVDVDFHNPSRVISISETPCLNIGRDGCFDDNGVILGDVVYRDEQFYMYYVGFQSVQKAKFLAFSGLAISSNGVDFNRLSEAPILDRDRDACMINAIHSIMKMDDGTYRAWHAKGNEWQVINNKPYPKYNIWSSTSNDGIYINNDSSLCVDNIGLEYRTGRPSVYFINNIYVMFYTKGTILGSDYYPGVAISKDGISWERRDELFSLPLSQSGWDSKHIAYPRLIKYSENKYYLFYNGNDMGISGFGYVELFIEN